MGVLLLRSHSEERSARMVGQWRGRYGFLLLLPRTVNSSGFTWPMHGHWFHRNDISHAYTPAALLYCPGSMNWMLMRLRQKQNFSRNSLLNEIREGVIKKERRVKEERGKRWKYKNHMKRCGKKEERGGRKGGRAIVGREDLSKNLLFVHSDVTVTLMCKLQNSHSSYSLLNL